MVMFAKSNIDYFSVYDPNITWDKLTLKNYVTYLKFNFNWASNIFIC